MPGVNRPGAPERTKPALALTARIFAAVFNVPGLQCHLAVCARFRARATPQLGTYD